MIVLLDSWAWADLDAATAGLRPGTLVIAVDPTRGGGGPSGPIRCYLAARKLADGTMSEWKSV